MEAETYTLERIASLVQDLGSQLQTILRTHTIALNDLGDPAWKMVRPIIITVEQHAPDDFVACFYDADIYGYGDSIPSSLEDLKSHLVSQYEFLLEESQCVELGYATAQQFLMLQKIMKQKSTKFFII